MVIWYVPLDLRSDDANVRHDGWDLATALKVPIDASLVNEQIDTCFDSVMLATFVAKFRTWSHNIKKPDEHLELEIGWEWWILYLATRVKQHAAPAWMVENTVILTPNIIWLPHMGNLFLHMHLGTGSCSCVEGGGVLLVRSSEPCRMRQTQNEANRKITYMRLHGTKNVSQEWN